MRSEGSEGASSQKGLGPNESGSDADETGSPGEASGPHLQYKLRGECKRNHP